LIRVRGKFRNYSIINADAPAEGKDDEEKGSFYLQLGTVYSQCPKHDIKIVLGDFNAKLSKEENNYPHSGRNGLHEECNGNGHKLVQFAATTGMIIGETIFTHKNTHKVTWRSPDEVTMNQIDHVLIQEKHFSNLRDVRCRQGANVDSDHHLVVAKIQARISANKIHRVAKGAEI
jgi:endonuclease/exonuclease/phosphatase family metal-dependent hydrolase